MAKQKLTPEFPGSMKPFREGVYQRLFASGLWLYAKWTGMAWLTSAVALDQAASMTNISGLQDTIPWRGLAEQPNGSKP